MPIIFLQEKMLLGSRLTGMFFLYHQIDKEFENIQKPDFNFHIEIKYVRKSRIEIKYVRKSRTIN